MYRFLECHYKRNSSSSSDEQDSLVHGYTAIFIPSMVDIMPSDEEWEATKEKYQKAMEAALAKPEEDQKIAQAESDEKFHKEQAEKKAQKEKAKAERAAKKEERKKKAAELAAKNKEEEEKEVKEDTKENEVEPEKEEENAENDAEMVWSFLGFKGP